MIAKSGKHAIYFGLPLQVALGWMWIMSSTQSVDPAAIARGLSERVAMRLSLMEPNVWYDAEGFYEQQLEELWSHKLVRRKGYEFDAPLSLTPLGVAVREEILRDKANTPPAGGEG